jgi:anti-sigma factor RsiW
MPCNSNPATLGAYLDNELPPDQMAVLRQHVPTCARCAGEIAELAKMQRSLRPARERFAPSPEFRRKLEKQLGTSRRRSWSFSLVPALAVLVIMLLLGGAWFAYSHRASAFAEAADLHVNALASANPVDVVSTDRHTVKPWYQGRIPFSFNLPEFQNTGYTLIGGRLVYFHQQAGAQLLVGLRQHKISVLIFQETPELARAFAGPSSVEHRNSFSIDTWSSQDLRFVVIGDADPASITKLAQFFRQANS